MPDLKEVFTAEKKTRCRLDGSEDEDGKQRLPNVDIVQLAEPAHVMREEIQAADEGRASYSRFCHVVDHSHACKPTCFKNTDKVTAMAYLRSRTLDRWFQKSGGGAIGSRRQNKCAEDAAATIRNGNFHSQPFFLDITM